MEYECLYPEVPGNYCLLYRIFINIMNIMPWKSQHFFLSCVAFMQYQKIFTDLVVCLKVYNNGILIEDGFKRTSSPVIFIVGKLISDLWIFFLTGVLSLKSDTCSLFKFIFIYLWIGRKWLCMNKFFCYDLISDILLILSEKLNLTGLYPS